MKIEIVQPDGKLVSIDWSGDTPDLDNISKAMRDLFPEGKISIENAVRIYVGDMLRRKAHVVNVSSTVKDILDKYLGADPIGFPVFWNSNRVDSAATLADLGITQSNDINAHAGFLARVAKAINVDPVSGEYMDTNGR